MFEVLIVKPIFNLLVLIYGLLPGHNFGLSIILFTILIRLLMWPLVKKQLHQAKAMREMQPEIKRIKQASKGNRQQESVMLMELYKERGISPFGSIGILIVQIVILLGLYAGLNRLVNDPQTIFANSYTFLHNLGGLKLMAENIQNFDATLFGLIDLTRPAINKTGGFYYPALYLVIGSAIAQYYQSKQLMPNPKDGRGLRAILREAGTGKKAEQAEVSAAVGKSTRIFLPLLIVVFTINLASALSLYWLTTGIVAYIQQARILGQDETEMEKIADQKPSSKIIEGEIIEKPKTTPKKKKATAKKRRKK